MYYMCRCTCTRSSFGTTREVLHTVSLNSSFVFVHRVLQQYGVHSATGHTRLLLHLPSPCQRCALLSLHEWWTALPSHSLLLLPTLRLWYLVLPVGDWVQPLDSQVGQRGTHWRWYGSLIKRQRREIDCERTSYILHCIMVTKWQWSYAGLRGL